MALLGTEHSFFVNFRVNVVLDSGVWKKMVADASSNAIDIVLCHGPPHGGLGGKV